MSDVETGTYEIFCLANGKRYVGSTQRVVRARRALDYRWVEHRSRLRSGSHSCPHLQAAWNKYGETNFVFRVLERLPPQECLRAEQALLDAEVQLRVLGGKGLFNHSMSASARTGPHREETKAKLRGDLNGSRKHPDRVPRGDQHYSRLTPEKVASGDANGSRTKPECLARGAQHWTRRCPKRVPSGDVHHAKAHPERLARGSQQGSAKLTEEFVRDIRARHGVGESMRALARAYNVNPATISYIVARKTWRHVP